MHLWVISGVPRGISTTQTHFKLLLAFADILLAKGWKMASAYSKNMARVWAQVRTGPKGWSTIPCVLQSPLTRKFFLLDLKEQRRYFCLLMMAINRWLVSALVIFLLRDPNSWRFKGGKIPFDSQLSGGSVPRSREGSGEWHSPWWQELRVTACSSLFMYHQAEGRECGPEPGSGITLRGPAS